MLPPLGAAFTALGYAVHELWNARDSRSGPVIRLVAILVVLLIPTLFIEWNKADTRMEPVAIEPLESRLGSDWVKRIPIIVHNRSITPRYETIFWIVFPDEPLVENITFGLLTADGRRFLPPEARMPGNITLLPIRTAVSEPALRLQIRVLNPGESLRFDLATSVTRRGSSAKGKIRIVPLGSEEVPPEEGVIIQKGDSLALTFKPRAPSKPELGHPFYVLQDGPGKLGADFRGDQELTFRWYHSAGGEWEFAADSARLRANAQE
jgi:hypothetical protein